MQTVEEKFPGFVKWVDGSGSPKLGPCQGPVVHLPESLENFDEELHTLSGKIHEKAIQILKEEIPELETSQGIAIGCTGSDGRLEKLSPLSPMELIVYTDDVEDPLIEKIQEVVSRHPIFSSVLEVKTKEENLLLFTSIDPARATQNTPFPSRGLDASYLIGSKDIWDSAKTKFFQDVKKETKSINKWKESTFKGSIKAMENTVSGRDYDGVSMDEGKLFISGDRVKAVKYPFLRPIQYQIVSHCLHAIREGVAKGEEVPGTVAERIDWLQGLGYEAPSKCSWADLKDTYFRLLVLYGISQNELYEHKHSEIYLDKAELEKIALKVEDFATHRIKRAKKRAN